MNGIDVDVRELNAFERILVAAGVEITIVSEAALTKAARQLRDDAKRDAPVDTGELQRSIRISAGKEYRRVGSKTRQGFFQEFGTSKMAPQPWLYSNGERAGVTVQEELSKGGVRLVLGPG